MDTLENVKMDNIKTRHVMSKQVQEKNGPAIVFAPKNCSPGNKWKNPVLVASIRSLKTPSPSLSRGLLPRVCVMRMATLKVCHTSFWLIWDSINPSVRCPENRKWNVTSGKYQGFFLRVHFEFQIYLALALPTAQYVHSSPAKNIPNEIAATFYIWLGKRNTSKTRAAWVQSRKLMCQSTGTTSSMNAWFTCSSMFRSSPGKIEFWNASTHGLTYGSSLT